MVKGVKDTPKKKEKEEDNIWDYIDETEQDEPIRTYKAQAPYFNLW